MTTNPSGATATVPVETQPASQVSQSALTWLKSLGPGLVYALTVMGAGDIVTNSAAGAEYGYALLWGLGLTLLFRFVWVNTSAKYVLVTGESLLQGYARLGNWIIWVVVIALILLRHLYNLYAIILVGSTWDVLFHLGTPWSTAIWTVFFTFIGYAIITRGGYRTTEFLCKILVAVMGLALIVAASLSEPDPMGIVQGSFIPTLPVDAGLYSAVLVLMALIGTEAGSLTNLTYPYFMYEKGWRNISFLKQQRFDLAFGVACIFIMGAMLQIAAAGTLRPLGVELQGPEHLVQIFSQSLGWVGLVTFALGLWGAAFTTYVGATVGYGLIITDICRSAIPRFKRPQDNAGFQQHATNRDPIYRWSVAFWVFSPLYIVFTEVSPVWLVLAASSFMVVLIPALAFALLRITNDRKLMGAYKNGIFTNSVMVLLILVALYFTYLNAAGLLR